MKKGRHRRFEEARKLKQSGPAAFGGWEPRPSQPNGSSDEVSGDDDEYAALAAKYGVTFEDDDASDGEDEDD